MVEQDWRMDNFKKKEGIKKNKIAVENCDGKNESKPVMLEMKTDFNHGPKMWQCSGGNGNDLPSRNEPVGNETKQGNQTTAYPSAGNKNNDEDFGGDGNDPSKTAPKLIKGHYLESALPLKKKDAGIV